MGQILLNTPQGRVKVNIAGDAPTSEEQAAIIEHFYPDQAPTAAPNIDLATASMEEIREFARQRRAMGVSPTTGQPLTEEEFVQEYKEPGVDYSTGVDDVEGFSRVQFGRMETPEEKAAYLESRVGPEGYRRDALGRFIITGQGRQTLGMGEGKDIAIDEEGLSFGDVKEFFGQSGVPIATGLGAALMTSGVGFVPGALITAAAAGTGKLLDEAVEYAEGYQRQSLSDVGRDAAMEAVFAGLGETVGRGLSALFGRMIKGPGGAQNEALRAEAREMINRGLRPTVAGATSEEFRPVLNRLQAVYEGVFPNQAAAQNNLNILLQELRGVAGVTGKQVDDLGEIVQRDIASFYGSQDDLLAMAQRNLDDAIKNEIDAVIKPLKQGQDVPENLVRDIMTRKSLFDEDLDRLYTRSTDILKGGNNIVPTAGIKRELEELIATSPADIGNTKFARLVTSLPDYATPLEINRLRKALTDASYNPDLVAGVQQGALGALKSAVNDSMIDAELALQRGLNTLQQEFGVGTSTSVSRTLNSVLKPGAREAEDVALSVSQLKDGLSLLRKSNQLYRQGISRFDNVVVQDIIKQAKKGQLNTRFIFDKVIQADNPEALDQLLKAVRGVPNLITDIGESRRFLQRQRIGTQTVEEALETVRGLPANDPTRRFVEQQVAALEADALQRSAFRGTGAQAAEQLRENLAKTYLDRALSRSRVRDPMTGQRVIDPVKLAANLREKGTTVDRLFGKDKTRLDEVIDALETGKSNVAPDVAEQLASRPLADALDTFKTRLAERKGFDRNAVLRELETGDVGRIADAVLKQPNAVSMAKRALAPETMEAVRDEAMGRIINQIGGVVEEGGQIRLTGNFLEQFISGGLGNKLSNVLKSYGESHIDSLFGKNTYSSLTKLADDMTAASNAAIKGKGGLAAPQIALSLSVVGLLTNPIATLSTGLGFKAMSQLLRNPTVLKAMMASRSKNTAQDFFRGKLVSGDPIGQGFQAALQIAAGLGTQAVRGSTEQTEQETQAAQRMAQQAPQTSSVTQQLAPIAESVLGQVDVLRGDMGAVSQTRQTPSPILVPDPITRATFEGR